MVDIGVQAQVGVVYFPDDVQRLFYRIDEIGFRAVQVFQENDNVVFSGAFRYFLAMEIICSVATFLSNPSGIRLAPPLPHTMCRMFA